MVRWTDAGRSFERQRVEFTELRLSPNAPAKIEVESHADFVLASDGALESVALNERVSAWDAKGQVDARLLHTLDLKPIGSRKSVPLVFADKTVSRTPGVHHDEIDVKRALLEARAGDWDTAKILETLASVEDSDQFPDHHRFVWQATGYLELHPEACAELVGAFVEARSEDMGAQIVDLLLGAGHAEAQSAMRAILDLDEARQNPDVYHQLYQRLGMVPEPTPESIAWLLESRESALAGDDSELLRVQGFTLGAVARGVRKSDPEQANALGDLLLDDLENAASNDDAAVALRALGNSGDPRAVDAVTDRFQSEDPSVRAAAAIALRLVPTEEATQLLIGSLESERSRAAQSAALDALRHREL
ncbi:MAG: HEAT repeat domain-containing protein, partial [Myxococcota bacterium]